MSNIELGLVLILIIQTGAIAYLFWEVYHVIKSNNAANDRLSDWARYEIDVLRKRLRTVENICVAQTKCEELRKEFESLSKWCSENESMLRGTLDMLKTYTSEQSKIYARLNFLEGTTAFSVKGEANNPIIVKEKKPAKKQIVVQRKPRKVKQ